MPEYVFNEWMDKFWGGDVLLVKDGEEFLSWRDIDPIYQLNDADTDDTSIFWVTPSSQKINAVVSERKGFYFEVDVNNGSEEEEYLDFPVWNYSGYSAKTEAGEFLRVVDGGGRRVRVVIPDSYAGKLILEWKEPILWRIAETISVSTMFCFTLYWVRRRMDAFYCNPNI